MMLRRKGGGPRMRSALHGWTWTLRGRGAQSTAGSGSLKPLPEEDSNNVLFIAPLVSILGPEKNILPLARLSSGETRLLKSSPCLSISLSTVQYLFHLPLETEATDGEREEAGEKRRKRAVLTASGTTNIPTASVRPFPV
jgi:hypothetical protein